MKSLTKNFGERIEDLASEFDTYKEAAKSLGVSERTLRRWRKRKSIPTGSTKFNKQKLSRRERYYYKEKPKRIYEQRRKSGEFRVEPEVSGSFDLTSYMPGAISPWQIKDLIDGAFFGEAGQMLVDAIGRKDIIYIQMHGQAKDGKTQSHITILDDYEDVTDFISDVYEAASRFYGDMGSGATIALGPKPIGF